MNEFRTAIKIFLYMTVLTGLFYPLLITLIAQFGMPYHANGSLIYKGKRIIGSKLIAQKTTDQRYFWPRPSAIDYNPIAPSGGSNLGPTSRKLREMIDERKQNMGNDAPPELLYASGSGLDPHISLETAYYQIPRVAKARSIEEDSLKKIINLIAKKEHFSLLKPRYVNVLLLNEALDEQ